MGTLNQLFAAQKAAAAHGPVTISFPDVCLPAGPHGPPVPIPYPSAATRAAVKQQNRAKKSGRSVTVAGSKYMKSTVDKAVTMAGRHTPDPVVMLEAGMLRGMMASLNAQLQNLPAGNPERWQRVLQDYLVAVGALYTTITVDDDDD